MTPRFTCSPDLSPRLQTHTSTADWTAPFVRQTDISESLFQAELLISSHSPSHGLFHPSWWQLHPLAELLMHQALESAAFLSSILDFQSIQKFYWFYLPNRSTVFSLPITTLVWTPILSYPADRSCFPLSVLALPLLPSSLSKQTDSLTCKIMVLLCFSFNIENQSPYF